MGVAMAPDVTSSRANNNLSTTALVHQKPNRSHDAEKSHRYSSAIGLFEKLTPPLRVTSKWKEKKS